MSRTTTLPPVETTPILLIRFTARADTHLIAAVQERLSEEGLIVVETEYKYEDENAESVRQQQRQQQRQRQRQRLNTIIGITTTHNRLERQAQIIRLLKRRQDTHIMEAFDVQQKHKYCDTSQNYRDNIGLFSSNDWSLLANRILEDTTVLPEGQLSSKLSKLFDQLNVPYHRQGHGHADDDDVAAAATEDHPQETNQNFVPKLLGGMRASFPKVVPTQSLRHTLEEAGFIDAVAPIHRTALKNEIWQQTRSLLTSTIAHPPVQLMRQYYGEEIAFYFAWMGVLTQWLLVPAVIGLGAYVYRWYREDTIMTDEYTPFYGILTYFWSLLFLKFWKRHEARLSYQWGVQMGEYEKAKYFAVRPEYYGSVWRQSPVTGQLEAYYPDWRRRAKQLASAVITLILLNAAFWIMILSLNMQGYINPKYDPTRWSTESHHPFHWPRLSKLAEPGGIFDMTSGIKSLIPVVLHVATIFTFNSVYRIVATHLTKWENHATQLQFNNSLILKRFLFEAFDCYVALFYLAFYERNIDKLRSELVSVFNIDTIRRLALECLVPMILQWWRNRAKDAANNSNKKTTTTTKDGHPPQAASSTTTMRYTPLADQAELDEYEQFDDFMEIIIQFGYVTLFASAYPLASAISIVANLIEIRADAFRITYLCQRPRSIRCDGLNMWNKLLGGIVRLSALTNCLIFGFTSGQLMEWLPSLYQMDETDHMRFTTDKGWIVIFIIFGLERILLWSGMLLDAFIPDVPEDVMNQLERRYFVLQEESRKYEHQEELKRKKKAS